MRFGLAGRLTLTAIILSATMASAQMPRPRRKPVAPVPAPAQVQPPKPYTSRPGVPANLQEPSKAFMLYLVNPDGSLSPTEHTSTREFRWSGRVHGYFSGEHSPVVIPRGSPMFAYRVELRPKEFAEALTYKIEKLTVHMPGVGNPPSNDGRRYATSSFVQVHTEPYGPRKGVVNPERADVASQTFLVWPLQPLDSGEYAFTVSGIFGCTGCGGGGYAFSVSDTATATEMAPSPAAPVNPPVQAPTQTATALVTIESSPANAEVSVDGDFIGTTPLAGYRMDAGVRRVVVTKRGYAPWTRELKVTAGVDTRLTAELESTALFAPLYPR
jgi:hypothetical protein